MLSCCKSLQKSLQTCYFLSRDSTYILRELLAQLQLADSCFAIYHIISSVKWDEYLYDTSKADGFGQKHGFIKVHVCTHHWHKICFVANISSQISFKMHVQLKNPRCLQSGTQWIRSQQYYSGSEANSTASSTSNEHFCFQFQ